MRTTLTLEPDVAAELERRRRERRSSLKDEVNELLRIGLLHADQKRPTGSSPFRTQSVSVGRLLVDRLDDVTEALERAEGDAHR